jgi:hypothetical protein
MFVKVLDPLRRTILEQLEIALRKPMDDLTAAIAHNHVDINNPAVHPDRRRAIVPGWRSCLARRQHGKEEYRVTTCASPPKG